MDEETRHDDVRTEEASSIDGLPATDGSAVVHTRNLGFIQRDYINPKNLGFMKVILFFFGLNIMWSCVKMAVITGDAYEFNFSQVIDLLNIIFDAVSFWLIWRRKSVARWWVIGFAAFNIIVGSAVNVVAGNFTIVSQVAASVSDIILILYFLIAKRVKICLDQPFSLETYKREDQEDRDCFKPKTWPFWRNLIMYFCVFSVVGHWMEAGYCTLIKYGIIPGVYDPNSGIWSNYLSPFMVYGFGVVACVLLFYPLKLFLQKKFPKGWKGNFAAVFITFVVAGIVCCMIELAMGLMMNMNYELWDYRDMFCNFMGQICLQNGIAFGMVATLMTWIIYPALERVMDRLPKEIGNGLCIAVVLFFLLIWLLYCFTVPQEVNDMVEEATVEQTVAPELEGMDANEIYNYIQDKVAEANVDIALAESLEATGDHEGASEMMKAAGDANELAIQALDYYRGMPENGAILTADDIDEEGTVGSEAFSATRPE